MKTKTVGTLLIAGLVVLSAMVVFATPAMAVDIWEGEDECDDDDPIENFEKPPKTTGYDLKVYNEWDGKRDKPKFSKIIRFTGTITMEDGPWADKHVAIVKRRNGMHGEGWYTPLCGQWKVMTDSEGNYQTEYALWRRPGHFGLCVRETTSDSWELLEELDLVAADYDKDGLIKWTYIWDYKIPEFATIALPAASILGLLFFFNHRKRKKE